MSAASASDLTHIHELTREAVRGMRTRPVVTHPEDETISAGNVAWARDFGLATGDLAVARMAGIRCGSFAAYCYPAGSTDVVRLAADIIAWLFLFDDAFCEDFDAEPERLRGALDSYESVLRNGTLPLAPTEYHVALLDIANRARVLGADEQWMRRFTTSISQYFQGCLDEIPFRHAGTAPTLAEYRNIRMGTAGARPTFDFIELANGALLHQAPEFSEAATATDLSMIRETAALVFGWINDIYSYHKESDAGDPLNLVAVLKRQYALNDRESFAAAVDVFNTELSVVDSIAMRLRARGVSAPIEAYLSGLDDWIHGNLAWTSLCGRYHR